MRRMFSEKQVENIVRNIIESGQVDNAKPIYRHVISVIRGNAENQFTFLGDIEIYNNDATPFTATTFLNLLKIQNTQLPVINGKCNPHYKQCSDITSATNCNINNIPTDKYMKCEWNNTATPASCKPKPRLCTEYSYLNPAWASESNCHLLDTSDQDKTCIYHDGGCHEGRYPQRYRKLHGMERECPGCRKDRNYE